MGFVEVEVWSFAAFGTVAGEEVALRELAAADLEWGCGVDVGDEDLFVLFDWLDGLDEEFFAVETDCCVVVATVVD